MRSWFYRVSTGALVALAIIAGPVIFNACSSASDKDDNSGQVSGLVVTPGNQKNTLKWEPMDGVDSYDIYWKVGANSTARVTQRNYLTKDAQGSKNNAFLNHNYTFFEHEGLMNGTEYSYIVVPSDHSIIDIPWSMGYQPGLINCVYAGQTACDPSCVYLETDEDNCGACGNRCADGQSCIRGFCDSPWTSCQAGTTNCAVDTNASRGSLECADLRFDEQHCGACGNACDEGKWCYEGNCLTAGSCPDGRVRCFILTPAGPFCSELTDRYNCGSCGNVCTDGKVCINGNCETPSTSTCAEVSGDQVINCPYHGGCTDIMNDSRNCGACGTNCASGYPCVNGVCDYSSLGSGSGNTTPACATGLTYCNSSCVDTTSNNYHCGSCGNRCTTGAYCGGSVCITPVIPQCPSGQTRCGEFCVQTQTDKLNCGACGKVCDGGGSAYCFNGACNILI